MIVEEHRFFATESTGEVSALLLRPDDAWALFVYGHGAGAGMKHAFMEATAHALAAHGLATFRYHFPYMEQGRKRPDYGPKLVKTVRSAVAAGRNAAGDLPLFAGGKSMGGRMTSMAASTEALDGVRGLAFFGFPLHSPAEPGVERGEHLQTVTVPMLFLQGTRDKLAQMELIEPVIRGLGESASMHVVEGADHGFHVLKRSGRTDGEVIEELADACVRWAKPLAEDG